MDGPAPQLFDLSDPSKLAHWLLRAAEAWSRARTVDTGALVADRKTALAPLDYHLEDGEFDAKVIGGVRAAALRSHPDTDAPVDVPEVLAKAVTLAIGRWRMRQGYQALLELLVIAARLPALEAIEPALNHLRSGELQSADSTSGPNIGATMIDLADMVLPSSAATSLLEEVQASKRLWAPRLGTKVATARAKLGQDHWLELLDRYCSAYSEYEEGWDRIDELREFVRAAGLQKILLDTFAFLERATYDPARNALQFEDARLVELLELLFKEQSVGGNERTAAIELASEALLEFQADDLSFALLSELNVINRGAEIRGEQPAGDFEARIDMLVCLCLGQPRRDRMPDLYDIFNILPEGAEPPGASQEAHPKTTETKDALFRDIARSSRTHHQNGKTIH